MIYGNNDMKMLIDLDKKTHEKLKEEASFCKRSAKAQAELLLGKALGVLPLHE